MTSRVKIRAMAVVLIMLAFSHCYLVSEFLIGGESAVITDDPLPGLWHFPGKSGYMLIAAHKNKEYSFHYFTDNFVADAEYFAGKLTRVGGKTFFNVRRYAAMGEKAADEGFVPVYYKLDGDKLHIAIFETKIFDEAINAKKLTGQAAAKTSAYSSSKTRLTSRGEDIAKFILENFDQPGLLEKTQLMERIKVELPKVPPADAAPK